MVVTNKKTTNAGEMDRTNNTQTKICSNCGFAENPPGADNCLQCGRALDKSSKGQIPSKIWSSFPLLLLLAISGGLGLLWRKNSASLKQDTEEAIAEAPSTATTKTYKSGLQLKESLTQVSDVPQGVFYYGGAMASAGIRSQDTMAQIAKAQPQFQLTYEDPLIGPPDSGKGIQMLIDGTISFAESFRPLKQSEYDLANSRGFKLKQVPVATSAIAFYVNPDLDIPGLSLDEIEQIYSGRITNWKQLGGPDLAIAPISQDPDAKVPNSFLLQGMPNSEKKFGTNVKVERDTTSAIRKVAQTKGAIGYGAQPLVVGQKTIRPIGLAKRGSKDYVLPTTNSGTANKQAVLDGSYPLIRRIFIILREDGEIDELAGRAYVNLLLSQEGQGLIDSAGYLPVRYQGKPSNETK